MYCNQCEQTSKGIACTAVGVCGKKPEVALLQDLITHAVRGVSLYAVEARKKGIVDLGINRDTCEALFTTLTNVNFDPDDLQEWVRRSVALRDRLKEQLENAGGRLNTADQVADFVPAGDLDGMLEQSKKFGHYSDPAADQDVQSLQLLLVYGLRGLAAYAHHAQVLGQEDDAVYAFVHEGLAALSNKSLGLNDYLGLVMKCGEVNIRAMELLDAANTGLLGHPEPTPVKLGHRPNKCILVSGHDLKDLEDLLKLTEGKGIDIYTHGEMLPAHGYPELKKFSHLYGHYGTAWQNQKKEFVDFPGAILMTTNCIQEPGPSYKDNIFTTGPVGWPGVKHVANGEFGAVMEKALAMPGFNNEQDKGTVMVGFARKAVLSIADTVVSAVKGGDIKHFFLVAGCDGAKPGRNYYTEFVEKTPKDTVVMTLACGKFRFFDKQLGDIGGIPRLLDVGQCNDAYSAVQIALALADAFNCGVNDLPLSMVLSWYEQKAVSILLSLLYLGIKDIRLGPTLPAFISPNVLNVLVEKFGIKPITTADEDLAAILH